MSHNLFQSGALQQNINGDLLLSTSNVSEFTGLTPQRNVIIQSTNSTSWSFDKLARVASVPLSWETASGTYSIGSYDYEAEDNFVFHTTRIVASSGVTLITASGDYSPITSNSFYMAYRFDGSTFDGKTIILEANLAPDCQASFVAQWCIGTGALTSVTPIVVVLNVMVPGQMCVWSIYRRWINCRCLLKNDKQNRFFICNSSC